MYTKKHIHTENIILTPNELDNINKNINTKLQAKIGTCTKTDGYITDISEVIHIGNALISRTTGNCIFKITFETNSLKPVQGHVYDVVIKSIFKEGLFTEYKNIQILIPYSVLDEWIFKGEYFVKGDNRFECDDIITIIIDAVRYGDHAYQCIGRLHI